MNTDLQLIQRYAHSRDAEAFSELVGKYQNFVYGICLRILHNRESAEDVAQECFMNLACSADTIRTSPAGWLHRRATRASIDTLKRNKARARREKVYSEMKEANSVSAWEKVAPLVDLSLDELPEELRYVLVEHFLRRRTQAELAKELNVSTATLSRRVNTGVERLRRKLKKAGVTIVPAVLVTLLAEKSVAAAPATLTAMLGKMAISGVGKAVSTTAVTGGSAAATGTSAAATAVAAGLKMKIAATVAATVIAAGAATTYVATKHNTAPVPAVNAKGNEMQAFSEFSRAFVILMAALYAPESQLEIPVDIVSTQNGIGVQRAYVIRRTPQGFDIVLRRESGAREKQFVATHLQADDQLDSRDQIVHSFSVLNTATGQRKTLTLTEPQHSAILEDKTTWTEKQTVNGEEVTVRLSKSIRTNSSTPSGPVRGQNLYITGHREGEMVVVQLEEPLKWRAIFGPPREVFLNDFLIMKNTFYDLNFGTTLSPPEEVQNAGTAEFFAWLKDARVGWLAENGIDLIASATKGRGLSGLSMTAIHTENGHWESPPVDLLYQLKIVKSFDMASAFMSAMPELPATYLIKTGDEQIGVLQLLEIIDKEPMGVRFRYKMVDHFEPIPSHGQVFGPVKKLVVNDSFTSSDKCSVDIDTAQLHGDLGLRKSIDEMIGQMAENHVDFLGLNREEHVDEVQGFLGAGVAVIQTANDHWDAPPLRLLHELLEVDINPMAVSMMDSGARFGCELPATCLIKTNGGSVGVLQITDLIKTDPRGVAIQYKLLEDSPEPEPEQATFGPVRELVVRSSMNNNTEECFVNLDTGEILSLPEEIQSIAKSEQLAWVKRNKIDAAGQVNTRGFTGLIGLAMMSIQTTKDQWDSPPISLLREMRNHQPDPTTYKIIHNEYKFGGEPPITYLIRTDEGAAGVLQILEVDVPAETVRFRYKLLEEDYRPIPSKHADFGPTIEVVIDDTDRTRATSFMDLDTGEFVEAPEGILGYTGGGHQWLKENGVDVFGFAKEHDQLRGMMGIGMIAFPTSKEDWDWPPVSLLESLRHVPSQDESSSWIRSHWKQFGLDAPATYIIRTNKGVPGVLQILEVDPVAGTTHFRYKLMQDMKASKPKAASATTKTLGPPKITHTEAMSVASGFFAALARGNTETMRELYAPEVTLKAGSQFLKDQWQINPGGETDKDFITDRDILLMAYEDLFTVHGRDNWRERFEHIAKNRDELSDENIKDVPFAVARTGDAILRHFDGPQPKLYLMRATKKLRWYPADYVPSTAEVDKIGEMMDAKQSDVVLTLYIDSESHALHFLLRQDEELRWRIIAERTEYWAD